MRGQPGQVAGAAQGLDFCFVILTRAVRRLLRAGRGFPEPLGTRSSLSSVCFRQASRPRGRCGTLTPRGEKSWWFHLPCSCKLCVSVELTAGDLGCPGRSLAGLGASLRGGALEMSGRGSFNVRLSRLGTS